MATCEENNGDVVNYLPYEIVVKIFSYLSIKELMCTIRIVCRRWFMVSYDDNLWTVLTTEDVKELEKFPIPELVHRLFCCNNLFSLKHLCLNRCDLNHVTPKDLSILPLLTPNLQELSLAFCSQLDKSLLEIFSDSCRKIQSLNLEDCEVTDDCLVPFCDHKITTLNVSHCNKLTDQSLYFISRWKIRKLNMDGVQWISNEAVEHLLQNCKCSLEYLWLDGDNLTDEGLKMLRCCYNIRVLKITYCEELTDVTLSIVCEMASLTSLSLRKGKNFSKEGLIFMFQNLKNGLYNVDFYDCQGFTDEAVHWLTQSSPHLITLDLSWCWCITDEGLKNIVNHCRNIQTLILIGLHELTGKPFQDTAERLPRLTCLDLTNCNSIIDDIIIDISRQIIPLKILNYYGDVVN